MAERLHSNRSIILRVDPDVLDISQFLRSDDSPGWGELEEKGIYKKEGAVVGKKMKNIPITGLYSLIYRGLPRLMRSPKTRHL